VDNLLTTANLTPGETRLFNVSLTNSQEVPPTTPTTTTGAARPASFGTAKLLFNSAQTAMTFSATINNIDLGGAQTADTNDNLANAHIHAGPAVAPGVNGPVVWGFFGSPFNDNNPNDQVFFPLASGVGGNFGGKWDAPEGNGTTLAAQLTNLRTGHAYVNFHTAQFGGGEIRGNVPAENAFRDSLVAGLNGMTETRATVLRKISEMEELKLLNYNKAFVAMEYFGYLRRDPDTSGFNFWQAQRLQRQLRRLREESLHHLERIRQRLSLAGRRAISPQLATAGWGVLHAVRPKIASVPERLMPRSILKRHIL
jgi:hypothetical protein